MAHRVSHSGKVNFVANVSPLDRLNKPARDREPGGTSRHNASILVIDDEPGMRNFLQRGLARHCALIETADSVEAAEELIGRCHFDLLVVDNRLRGLSGVEWLQRLRAQGSRAEVILMTAYADVETAIAALRGGAADFMLKPFRMEQMWSVVRRCLERQQMTRENFVLRRQVDHAYPVAGLLGQSEAVQEVLRVIRAIAATPTTVLIEGESGTGKELAARAIHQCSGRSGAFAPINCGSISPELLESELFGHTKGAFTGAHQAREGLFCYANGGTLFLDEISEMPLPMQAKLLRVLEEHRVRAVGSEREVPVDVRIIAATNQDLIQRVREGRFREDLYYRLNVLRLRMPPLRERADDIAELAAFYGHKLAAELGVAPLLLAPTDLMCLRAYAWPGNVRELKNIIERALLLGQSPCQCMDVSRQQAAENASPVLSAGYSLEWNVEQVEKDHILRVLATVKNNKSEAARRLGLSRKTLERKLHAWARAGA